MADFITVFSQNCRGLKNMQKRRDLFHYIRSKKYNIACLQDVHIDRNMYSYVKAEWGYNIILSAKEGTNASRGVMILINNNFSCDVGQIITDPDGNFVIMELKVLDKKITLASIYGPNEDKPQFYRNLKQKISDFGNDKVIICGDWNLVLNPDVDTENYRHINNPTARQEVLKFIDNDNYIDIYRFINDDKGFTWRRLNPEKKQARLDYFLISEETFEFTNDCKIVSGYRTDHSGITLKLKLNQNERGTSYWKFNNSLLKDKDYIQLVRWIEIFQNGSESCILQNGHMTEYFSLQRGCRQGDPISPYIFILCAEVLSHMIKKDKDIKGILINNKEFKLSQYADDTQIFLDGTEITLRKTLEKLNTFYLMSGLKLNIDKTKAIWIGSRNKSNRRLCKEYKLDWNQEPFKILGVTFTPEVFDIWDKNATDILKKVEYTIKAWSKRKLTLLGKITIIKSLALSKFVHLFLALPNPPGNLVKNLNKLFYSFLWNSGPDRIKRKFIVKDIEKGGLRMIQIDSFITALKVTWLRRHILQPDCSWSSLSNINMNSIFSKGENYAETKAKELLNPFWKDVLRSWKHFCKSVMPETLEDILYSPLWFNTHIVQGQNLYIKEWHDKGIRNVIDLLDLDGQFYQFIELKEKYNIHGTFLDYHSILRKLPADWKTKINQNRLTCQTLKQNVARNCYLNLLCKDKKGSRRLYDILIENKDPTPPAQKWANIIGNITQEEWNSINVNIKNIKEVKLKDFQFKINNHILVTKSFLFKINKTDNDICSLCNREVETIIHLFYYCSKVKEFWSDLQNWLQVQANITFDLTIRTVLFSKQPENKLLNHLLLLARYFIYKTKFFTNYIRLETFISYLKRKYLNEKYISKLHNNQDKFVAKWSVLNRILDNA